VFLYLGTVVPLEGVVAVAENEEVEDDFA